MGKEVTPISECEKAIVIVTPRSDVDAERPPLQAPRLPWRRAVPQVLASCAALSLALHAGVNMAMAAIMLPQMEAPDSAIRVDRDSASWIAAVVAVTTPVGSLASGPLMDVAGRRAACLWTAVPLVVAWLLLGLAAGPLPHVGLVYASRALAGLGGGLSTAAGVYVSETTHPSLRPALLCLNSVFVAAGILLVACLGLFLHWGWVAVVSACAAAGSGLAVLRLCPESPHWLLHMAPGRHAVYAERRASLARESLLRLNKNPSEAEAAWDRLIASPVKATEAGTQKSLRSLAVILQPASAKPMLILTAIFVVQQLSGTYVIIFYAVPLFAKIGSRMGTVFDEFSVMVIMSAVRFVMSLLTVLLSRRLGRRTMLIFSGLGMAVCSVAAGATLVAAPAPAASNTTDSVLSSGEAFEGSWTPLLLIITIVMFSSLGYLVLPWSLVSELLPLGSRAVGSGLLVSLAYLLMFGVVKSFPYLMAMVGARTIFYLFGGVAFAGTVFVFFYLPETLGRSLEEIEAVFVKRTSERASQREAAIATKKLMATDVQRLRSKTPKTRRSERQPLRTRRRSASSNCRGLWFAGPSSLPT